MTHKNSFLDALPHFPELSTPTKILFDAVRNDSIQQVIKAIEDGADIKAFEPFIILPDGKIEGGLDILQTACSPAPGRRVPLEVVAILLDAGADPNQVHPYMGGGALHRIVEFLPSNGDEVATLLIQGGAVPTIELISEALMAELAWVNKATSEHAIPLVETLWNLIPDEERALLDPNLPTQIIGNSLFNNQALLRAKWVLSKLPDIDLDLSEIENKKGINRNISKKLN